MNSFINTLSDTILSKNFESLDLEALRTLSKAHPYASAVQLLYAQKLKQAGGAGYAEQLQKTLLYYSNPLFIKHLIETEERVPGIIISENVPEATELPAAESVAIDGSLQSNLAIATPAATATAPAETEKPEAITIPEPVEENLQRVDKVVNIDDEIQTGADEDAEPVQPEEEADLPPLPQFKFEPIDPAKAELSFTPYHTIDYFAAQGIKLGDEQNAADRFGTQLKSFTAWLKQMKRLPGATAKSNISLTEEKSIEKMAEQSLQGENADTEAMAQVWAKQGNSKKAIEIYKKLSLQIPAKSAYFAAKIDHLKK
jgi:hypothetical protein